MTADTRISFPLASRLPRRPQRRVLAPRPALSDGGTTGQFATEFYDSPAYVAGGKCRTTCSAELQRSMTLLSVFEKCALQALHLDTSLRACVCVMAPSRRASGAGCSNSLPSAKPCSLTCGHVGFYFGHTCQGHRYLTISGQETVIIGTR